MPSTRPLGRAGFEITRIGFGAWTIGGDGRSVDGDIDAVAAIRRAVEAGVNWIDTAAVYGLGHSEEVIARALQPIPAEDRPLVFTKCGIEWDAATPPRLRRVLRPDFVREECHRSLRRLQADRLDLLQFHWPDEHGTEVEDSWAEMGRLIDEGKVRAGGVSNFGVALLDRCEAVRSIDSVQARLSPVSRGAGADLLPWCVGHGTGVLAHSPLEGGLLAGDTAASRAQSLAPDDWRRRSPEWTEPRLARNLAFQAGLTDLARRLGLGTAALAIGWVTAWPGVSGAVVGARSAEQVGGWIEALDVDLGADALEEISELVIVHGVGDGPVRQPGSTGSSPGYRPEA